MSNNTSSELDYRKFSTLSDEENIVQIFRKIFPIVYKFCPNNRSPFVKRVNNSIVNEKRWSKWKNNSRDTNHPPDFYNKDEKLMLEVMRVDHFMYTDNQGRAHNKNAENIAKIVTAMVDGGQSNCLDNNLILGAVELNEHDAGYNYNQYLDSFKRVLKHHIERIQEYRNNYPGYKLIFMIFDESASYGLARNKMEIIDGHLVPRKLDESLYHVPCVDENFYSVIRGIDVDEIIWVAPFKSITTSAGPRHDCQLMIIDPHQDYETFNYEPDLVVCLESPGGMNNLPCTFKYAGMRVFYCQNKW